MKRSDLDLAFLLRYENVAWYESGAVKILDRRIYPVRTEYVICEKHEEVANAISDMVTQSGGPYTAAGMGMALASYEANGLSESEYCAFMKRAAYTLSHARPTTVEKMMFVTERALAVAEEGINNGKSGSQIADLIFENTIQTKNDDYDRTQTMAEYLFAKIPDNGTVMTQCFAETIIGMLLRVCRKNGKQIKMICPETRPYYQGARLTASVVCDMGFEVTVISDNMPGYVMKEKKVDVFTSAADVITMDGYIVNKIGTFQIALAAHYWSVPFYCTGSPNKSHPTIDTVVIEMRDPALVLESMGTGHTMQGVKGYYPAFDVTPPKLCAGVVTPKGFYSPYDLPRYFEEGGEQLAP